MNTSSLKTEGVDISPEAVEKVAQCTVFITPEAGAAETAHMLRALRTALTASEKRVSELEMQSRGNWIDAEQLAAAIRHAVWEADNQAGVIDVDKLRAAMEKANG